MDNKYPAGVRETCGTPYGAVARITRDIFFFSPLARLVYFRGFIILCAFITETITRLTFLFPFESGLAPIPIRSHGHSPRLHTSTHLPFKLFFKSHSPFGSYHARDVTPFILQPCILQSSSLSLYDNRIELQQPKPQLCLVSSHLSFLLMRIHVIR